jgi:beta-glucuronidase
MQRRLFDPHPIRRTISLAGTWTYHFPPQGTQIDPADDLQSTVPYFLCAPGVWETIPALVEYRGQAVAVRSIEVRESGPVLFQFEGVSHTCRVFLDGREIGGHHNAFTPFACAVPHVEAGPHELRLWISNEHGELSALHVPNDYYNYGGISRPADMAELRAPVYLQNLRVTPVRQEGKWKVKVVVNAALLGEEPPPDLQVRIRLGDTETTLPTLEFVDQQAESEVWIECGSEVAEWSPASPQLTWIEARLYSVGELLDEFLDRFGFRTVSFTPTQLLLNDQPLRLAGVNRHEDHPDFGCALPLAMMHRDLALIAELGANAIRTSHYPNDPRFLDLCDERGFLVWEESHARGLFDDNSLHPRYLEQTRENTREMVLAHHNHPSIILWGYLNECDSWTEHGRAAYEVADRTIKELDTSRPTTYAACHRDKDRCQDIPDVASWNIYPLWYGENPPVEVLEELLTQLSTGPSANKPLILSEFGAGGIFGFRDAFRRAKLSEERQADILEADLAAFLPHPRVAGTFIWQYCDVRVDSSWSNARARAYNEKGLVDEYRRPKLAFTSAQKHLRAFLAGE